eukprot:1321910-Amorphochlora_amoeboformis.AAC.2
MAMRLANNEHERALWYRKLNMQVISTWFRRHQGYVYNDDVWIWDEMYAIDRAHILDFLSRVKRNHEKALKILHDICDETKLRIA